MRSGKITQAVVIAFLLIRVVSAAPPSKPVLKISPSSASVEVGRAAQLSATDASGNGVSAQWTSSAPSIATVTASGLVTGVSAGSAIITAKIRSSKATATVSVTRPATASPPLPNPLTVSCPANRSVVSATGSPVVVTYTATTAGGVAPITLVGNPASGSAFPVGVTSVSVRASSSDGQVATCGFSVTVTSSTIDPTWVQIAPGDSIQAAVNAHAGATTFYLRAGVHRRQQVSPKTDNKFIGEAGAVLDGENVATYAFIASSGPQRVTISGLVIRNYASADQQGAIHGDNGVGWVIENNQVYGNREIGVRIGRNWQVRRNKVYRNGVIGISGYKADGSLIEGNEVYENNYLQAPEQPILSEASGMKFGVTANIVIRSNNVHHNLATGIWIDHSLPTTIIEHNTVTDNAKHGIFFESSYTAKIRYNTADRNGGGAWVSGTWLGRAGIVITNSPNVEIYGNTVRDNVNGITAMNSNNPMTAPLGPLKIQNLYVHDNVVRMSIGKSGIAQNTGETQIYTSWNNRFEHNTYYLGTNTAYFSWSDLSLSERQWQSYGNDLTGTFVH
jgi:parallel beta-helix repeat protein